MLRLISIPIGLMLLVVASLYWSGSSVAKRADLTFINRGDIITLDLNLMSYQQDFRLTQGIREGLYDYHWEDQRAINAGAEREESSPDGKVWTFHLRKDAKWSNGDPVTAHDYIFSWRRFLEEPGEYTYLFYYVKNASEYEKAYTEGKPIPLSDVGMQAVDDYTFRVTLESPVPFMKDLMAFPPFFPRHQKSMAPFRGWTNRPVMEAVTAEIARAGRNIEALTIDEVLEQVRAFDKSPAADALAEPDRAALKEMAATGKIAYTFRNEYTRPPHVVTNGPYNLTDWQFKRRLWLEKSPTYWDKDAIQSDTIEMIVNENQLSQFLQYEAGTVDWLADVTPDLAAELKKRGRTDLRVAQAFGTAFLTLLVTPELPKSIHAGKNPLADIRVRQALTMAIDKEFITEKVTGMGEPVATTYFPPGSLPDFDVKPGHAHDVAQAKRLLAEAGYPEGKGFPVLPLLFNSENPVRARMAQRLKQNWNEALGIDVEIDALEVKMYRDKVTKKNYAIAIVAWYGDYPDVSTFTDKYLSTSLQNDSGWANPRYDELLALAKQEPDKQKRLGYLLEAETLLDFEVPIIPLYHYVNIWMFRDGMQGLKANSRNQSDFKVIRVARE